MAPMRCVYTPHFPCRTGTINRHLLRQVLVFHTPMKSRISALLMGEYLKTMFVMNFDKYYTYMRS